MRQPGERRRRIFRYTAWDAVPALLALAQFALLAGFFLAWPWMAWPQRLAGAFAYAFAIGWSQESIGHNFIHNPFFISKRLNRLVACVLTLSNGAPQTMFAFVHMRHHAGNSDRPDASGETIDPISIYRHGAQGRAEPMLRYVILGFLRDDGPFKIARAIAAKRPVEARQALREFWLLVVVYVGALLLRWDFVLTLAPFYYLGQSLSFLIAYYEHLGAEPEDPMATGVSTYEPIYNLVFLNNGYHAEHHYRPKQHWTQMPELRVEMAQAGSRRPVIRPAHFLGFLDPRVWRVPVARSRGRRAAPA